MGKKYAIFIPKIYIIDTTRGLEEEYTFLDMKYLH
jgi:hypothetical protein